MGAIYSFPLDRIWVCAVIAAMHKLSPSIIRMYKN